MAAKGLTDKQKRFVDEYLVDLNATQAAIRAGYSAKTAKSVGSENLTKPDIQAAIRAHQKDRSERVGVSRDQVLNELSVIGFSDPRHYRVGMNGLTLEQAAPKDAMRAVASVKTRIKTEAEGGELVTDVEYKFWDKNSALEKIGKHLGMFVERHEVTISDVRGRVARTLEAIRVHVPDQAVYAAILKELRPIWQ